MYIADPVTITMDRREWMFILGFISTNDPNKWPHEVHVLSQLIRESGIPPIGTTIWP